MKQKEDENLQIVEEVNLDSPYYYFYSIGCVFCKQIEPIIDELNKEGFEILKLDISDKENEKIYETLKKEHNIKCGTPTLINADTGLNVCGYRDKDIIKKWLAGEEIPPLKTSFSPAPKLPLMGSSKKEEKKWIKKYNKWVEENSHLPNLQTAEQILEKPRPKTEPPQPPPNPSMSDDELKDWGEKYDVWKKDNEHLPNLQESNVIINQMKEFKKRQTINNTNSTLEQRVLSVEQKLDKLMNHLGVK